MIAIRTGEATNIQIDWLVAKCQGLNPVMRHIYMRDKAKENNYKGDLDWQISQQINEPIIVSENGVTKPVPFYSTDPRVAFPIIDKERLEFRQARTGMLSYYPGGVSSFGENHLTAGMRCFLVNRLGMYAEVPIELKLGQDDELSKELDLDDVIVLNRCIDRST